MTTRYRHDEVIWVWRCGVHFQASRRTIQHLDWTIARLKRRYPWARLHILQPCYHVGYKPSAGTHDYDCVLDLRITGLTWRHGQRFLRNCGWAAFWRHTGEWADKHAWHLHASSLPPHLPNEHPSPSQVGEAFHQTGLKVGYLIDGGTTTAGHTYATSQITDYMASPPRDALADHSPDPTYHPKDILKTVYVYDPWKAA